MSLPAMTDLTTDLDSKVLVLYVSTSLLMVSCWMLSFLVTRLEERSVRL